jgi:hypothetical protein
MDLTAKVEKLQEILERLEAKVDSIIEERKEQTSRELQNTKIMPVIAMEMLEKREAVSGSAATPLKPSDISKLPQPTFGSVVRYVVKEPFMSEMGEALINSPSEEVVSQHTIATNDNEILNISLVPDLEDMITKEDLGVNWLDTVEHMIVKFPNGSRTDAYSGPILYYWFSEGNAELCKDDYLIMSVVKFKVRLGCEDEFIEKICNSSISEKKIQRFVIQTDEREFISISKDSLDRKLENEDEALRNLDQLEHLLEFFGDSRTEARSGIVSDYFNARFLK